MSPSAPIGQSWKPPLSSASRPGVCADQRPVVLSAVTPRKHLVHDHPHIRERDHEGLSYLRDRRADLFPREEEDADASA
jgi:hypothetical protein